MELKVVPEASHGFLHMPIGHALQLQCVNYTCTRARVHAHALSRPAPSHSVCAVGGALADGCAWVAHKVLQLHAFDAAVSLKLTHVCCKVAEVTSRSIDARGAGAEGAGVVAPVVAAESAAAAAQDSASGSEYYDARV